eukprot:scaffold731_cov261-Pinguiococcus_pyrenoidosus.AAC.59
MPPPGGCSVPPPRPAAPTLPGRQCIAFADLPRRCHHEARRCHHANQPLQRAPNGAEDARQPRLQTAAVPREKGGEAKSLRA